MLAEAVAVVVVSNDQGWKFHAAESQCYMAPKVPCAAIHQFCLKKKNKNKIEKMGTNEKKTVCIYH